MGLWRENKTTSTSTCWVENTCPFFPLPCHWLPGKRDATVLTIWNIERKKENFSKILIITRWVKSNFNSLITHKITYIKYLDLVKLYLTSTYLLQVNNERLKLIILSSNRKKTKNLTLLDMNFLSFNGRYFRFWA